MAAQQHKRFVLEHPDNLRGIRLARGLSVAQLAAVVGVTTVTVRGWECGRYGGERGIDPALAVRLLRALRQDPRHPEALGRFTTDPQSESAHDPATRYHRDRTP